jgi:cytochrome oxidase Cu insertion factor (SCO1/SenC/PrrC family)
MGPLQGNQLGKQVHMYSVSIDSENDTPERLAAYAKEHTIPDGWHLLTTTPENSKQITDRFGKHLSGHHHEGVNLRMVHYGNGGVGLWGAFASEADPDLTVTRLSWVQNGQKSGTTLRRAGPAKLA